MYFAAGRIARSPATRGRRRVRASSKRVSPSPRQKSSPPARWRPPSSGSPVAADGSRRQRVAHGSFRSFAFGRQLEAALADAGIRASLRWESFPAENLSGNRYRFQHQTRLGRPASANGINGNAELLRLPDAARYAAQVLVAVGDQDQAGHHPAGSAAAPSRMADSRSVPWPAALAVWRRAHPSLVCSLSAALRVTRANGMTRSPVPPPGILHAIGKDDSARKSSRRDAGRSVRQNRHRDLALINYDARHGERQRDGKAGRRPSAAARERRPESRHSQTTQARGRSARIRPRDGRRSSAHPLRRGRFVAHQQRSERCMRRKRP